MTNKIIRRMEHLLFAGCFVCLALFTWTAGERAWFQRLYLQALRDAGDPDATPGLYNAAVSRPGPLGRIEISRASINAAILDGVDAGTLDRAVGHVPGTAYPGEANGRIALAAHRDSFFRNLGVLEKGDTILLETGKRVREYQVESTRVVKPDQTEVLAPTRDSWLTLITCYPFGYLGSAPDRFIVNARLVPEAAANRKFEDP